MGDTYIKNTMCPGSQAISDQAVILPEVVGVERSTENIVGQELPAGWKTEDVHIVIFSKVHHLLASGETPVSI
jgi:hypothetical protein